MEHADIKEELGQAGLPTTVTPEVLCLEKMRITPEKALKPMTFLFRLFGKPCFPRGELVAITGKAKSGKTFVTSMLMACCSTQKVLALERHTDSTENTESADSKENTDNKPLRVLWYDTEQSDESTQDILKNRVLKMIKGHPNREGLGDGLFDVFNVRGMSWQERRHLLGVAIGYCKPDLVIVDGIRDLVNDINDGVLAQEVMEELMQLATKWNCCITCVLHQNKGSEDHNLRGWIGTELMNKAFEVYSCEKLLPQRIFKVEQTLTRKYDIEQSLYFEVNEQGLPVSTAGPTEGMATARTERLPQMNRDYIISDENGGWEFDVMRLFLDAMRGKAEIGGAELRTAVCNLANITQYKFYNKLLQRALDEKVIIKVERDRLIFYQPAPF